MQPSDNQQQTIRMTFALPVELAEQLDSERDRVGQETRCRLSMNQIAVRVLRLGLERSEPPPAP